MLCYLLLKICLCDLCGLAVKIVSASVSLADIEVRPRVQTKPIEDSLPDVASRLALRSLSEAKRRGEVGSLRRRGEVRRTTSTRTTKSDRHGGADLAHDPKVSGDDLDDPIQDRCEYRQGRVTDVRW